MLFLVERAFVGRDEKRAPLKTPAGRLCKTKQNISLYNNILFYVRVRDNLSVIQMHCRMMCYCFY